MYFILNKHTADYVKVALSEAVLNNTGFFLPFLFSRSMGNSNSKGQSNCL